MNVTAIRTHLVLDSVRPERGKDRKCSDCPGEKNRDIPWASCTYVERSEPGRSSAHRTHLHHFCESLAHKTSAASRATGATGLKAASGVAQGLTNERLCQNLIYRVTCRFCIYRRIVSQSSDFSPVEAIPIRCILCVPDSASVLTEPSCWSTLLLLP